MAILGNFGRVEFKREWPDSAVVSSARLVPGTQNGLDVSEPGIWSGDRVALICPRGVPLKRSGLDYAPCPNGYSFYGETGGYTVGPALFRRNQSGTFYGNSDSSAFYEGLESVRLEQVLHAYCSRDDLDNLTFFASEADAINGSGTSQIRLDNLDFGSMLIAPAPDGDYSTETVQQVVNDLALYAFPEGTSEVVSEIALNASTHQALTTELEAMDTESVGWQQATDLSSWVFETNVDMLDQTAIGQQFGESVKGLLRGAGSFEGIVKASNADSGFDSKSMLKLMLLTQTGSKALAKFIFSTVTPENGQCDPAENMYYEAPILISSTTVNTRAGELITIEAQFVASGRVRIVTPC